MTLCHILPERRGWVNMDILQPRPNELKYDKEAGYYNT